MVRWAISADVCNLDKKVAKGYKLEYTLYANELYSDENVKVENVLVSTAVDVVNPGQIQTTKAVLNVKAPRKWSAEFPYRYTLVAELKNAKGKCGDNLYDRRVP